MSTPINLSDFQRFLTTHYCLTTARALEVCDGEDRDQYLKYFKEWESPSPSSVIVVHETPLHPERIER